MASGLLVLWVGSIGCSTIAAEPDQPAQVSIKNSRLIDFVSSVNGHRYSLSIGIPLAPPPAGGFPVLYVLDGDWYFSSAVGAVRVNGVPDVVVVGIGYPSDSNFANDVLARHQPLPEGLKGVPPEVAASDLERKYDLTPPTPASVLSEERFPPDSPLPRVSDFGGVDDFLQTIEKDVKPRVAELVSIDRTNQVLFGHSLGGLAVVRALFREPNAFRSFIAASPSIWWGGQMVLKDEAAFDHAVQTGLASPHVLITVGGEEGTPPKKAPVGLTVQLIRARMMRVRMIRNARALTAHLRALHGSSNYVVSPLAVFPKQTHAISPWPAIGRAISFAFPQ